LCERLQQKGIELTGTVRRNRKGLPNDLVKKAQKDFVRYAIYQKKKRNSKIKFIAWKDKRVVNLLTTVHSAKGLPKKKWDKKQKKLIDFMKPNAIHQYNMNCHGVDRVDQILSYFMFQRKCNKWWRKLFFYLLEITIMNSRIIYNMHPGCPKKLNSYEFRVSIIMALLQDNKKFQSFCDDDSVKKTSGHFPERTKDEAQLTCKHCHKGTTTYQCDSCKKSLHVLCFRQFHSFS